jgi:alcohol dehydrogenase class IV
MKQQEYFGSGSLIRLENILKDEKLRNVFLVTGRSSFELCGAQQILFKIFGETGCKFTRFFDFSPNPRLKEIEEGFNLFGEEEYDCIIGIGGGSCIDVAKSIKLFHYDETGKRILLVAIPTTAGSGSEATHFIVYYKGKEKQSEGNLGITLPDYAIIDPRLTESLPKKIVASVGMDALTQAIESHWSVNSTEESKKYSAESVRLIIQNLVLNANSPSEESREEMMKAANLAGKAINITKTTACHSISYPITSYFNVSHGHAAALTLAEMLVYNSKCNDETCNDKRGKDYVMGITNEIIKMLGAENVSDAYNKITNLMKSIGLETRLSNLGINKESIEIIIKNGFTIERVKNHPRLLTKENLRKILKNIY